MTDATTDTTTGSTTTGSTTTGSTTTGSTTTGTTGTAGVLRGFTVGITADRRWDEQAALFERRGATVLHGPTIRTLPLGSDEPLRAATETVIARAPAALVANTGLGIRSWFGAADGWGLGAELHAALATTRIFARGPKASGAIHSAGLAVDGRAVTERLAEAVDMALEVTRPGDAIAVQVDGSGTSPELARLRSAGMDVIEVPVYEWRMPDDHRAGLRLIEGIVGGRVHAVTFTTGPAVRNCLAIAAEHDLEPALREVLAGGALVVGCVGPVCAEAATRAGIPAERVVVPAAWRLGPLVRAVADQLVERTVEVSMGGSGVRLAGTAAIVDGTVVDLTHTEARLLAILAQSPNIVFTKLDLLRTVWGDEDADPHVVEVAVGRLRRRLANAGSAIAAVHRRGYALRT